MRAQDGLEPGSYYQFDHYTVDPDKRTLRSGDRLIDLTPKVFTTLLVLIEHRDKVLNKDELLTIIWPNQFVDQSNLSQNISVLRKSLGESESGKKYIATFPGRGYRFVGRVEVKCQGVPDALPPPIDPAVQPAVSEVERTSTDAPPGKQPKGSKTSRRYWKSAIGVGITVAILAAIVALPTSRMAQLFHPRALAESGTAVTVYARMDGALVQPCWSRNGKAIAFVALDLSRAESSIYVQSKGDIQPHLVLSASGQFSSPVWSPDGRKLAFLHFEPGVAQLVLFDLQSKSSHVLARLFARRYGLNFRHLDWSPDGKFLIVDDKTQDAEPFSLYLIYIQNGQRVRLTYPDSDMIGDLSPRVSPDSTKVAFIRDIDSYEQDVYITSVQGRTYQRMTPAHTLISDVAWMTRNAITFSANQGNGFRFWQMHLAPGAEKATLVSQVRSARALQLSVIQDGKMVAFSKYSPNLDIWSTDLGNPSHPWTPVIWGPGESIRPALSPDGKLLAFLSNVSGQFQIWVSRLDGTNASAISTGRLVPESFCWSSDGKALIFSPQRVHGLYEVPVPEDAPIHQLSPIYTDPQEAADGRSLFVRAHFFLYRLPLPGGKPRELTEEGGSPIAQSRDGGYLYFSQGRMSTTIARLNLQNGHQDALTDSVLPGYSDTWALSPRGIFFLGHTEDRAAIEFFDFSSDREEHVDDFPGNLPQIEMSGFAVSPDGKRLWVVRADPMPSDVEITSFRSE